jgi:hypothetical protein
MLGQAEHVERRSSSAPRPRVRCQTRLETAAPVERFPSVYALSEFFLTGQGQNLPWRMPRPSASVRKRTYNSPILQPRDPASAGLARGRTVGKARTTTEQSN